MGYGQQGRHLSYQRGKRNTNPNTSLLKIEGVDNPKDATFYAGVLHIPVFSMSANAMFANGSHRKEGSFRLPSIA